MDGPAGFCAAFLSGGAGGQDARQPRGVCHASCCRKALRLNRLLRPVGRAFMRAAARGKGRCPRKRPGPARGPGRFLTRRLLKKAGENF
ncbi:hypothetical protein B5F55_05685 [Anaerotruncus colihominis]|nr:hypothetical protein B5F55_05685 [Anaerotruncus colihominis]